MVTINSVKVLGWPRYKPNGNSWDVISDADPDLALNIYQHDSTYMYGNEACPSINWGSTCTITQGFPLTVASPLEIKMTLVDVDDFDRQTMGSVYFTPMDFEAPGVNKFTVTNGAVELEISVTWL